MKIFKIFKKIMVMKQTNLKQKLKKINKKRKERGKDSRNSTINW